MKNDVGLTNTINNSLQSFDYQTLELLEVNFFGPGLNVLFLAGVDQVGDAGLL